MTRRRSILLILTLALVAGPVPDSVAAAQQMAVVERASETVDTLVFARPVTVKLQHLSLRDAVITVGTAAGVHLVYHKEVLDAVTHPVTLHAVKMPLGKVFQQILNGTGLVVVPVQHDIVSIVPEGASGRPVAGIVTGTVRDVAAKHPIRGATVALDGAKSGVTTDNNGVFKITGVAPGTHRVIVRRIGYEMSSTTVDVVDGETATLTVALTEVVSRLTDVVTTAIGQQRRLEVGNVISHLNVDSLARSTPALSLTDLITARAPNVQVISSDGLVGSSASIRIRGQSSISLSNDPIVIVDGIRVNSTPGGVSSSLFGKVTSPSRLNDIDFNQIATIDILKGPAASTEYGTDAANGVIVITTKRGAAGPTQWTISANRGWSEIPTGFPEFYWAYGHNTSGAVVHCQLPNVAAGTCQIDSVLHDNPLNHPSTTIYGTGPSQSLDLGVSGGTDAVRFFVGGGRSQQIGTTHLPVVFKPYIRAFDLSSSLGDPNTQSQQSIRANLNARLNSVLDLTVGTSYATTRQMEPAGGNLTPHWSEGPPVVDSTNYYGYIDPSVSPIVTLGTYQSVAMTGGTISLGLDWRPTHWFSGHASSGVDRGTSHRIGMQSAQTLQWAIDDPVGALEVVDEATTVASTDVRAGLMLPVTSLIKSTTSAGLNLAKTTSRGLDATNFNLTIANPTLSNPGTSTGQTGSGAATAGGYAEEQVNVGDRLFVTVALRLDGASGFGGDTHTTAYPKVNASWLAFQSDAVTVRFRAALGAAGIQPDNGASLQQFRALTQFVSGSMIPVSVLQSPGNPNLRPERSREWEGGLDLGLLANRVNLELSGYSKMTTDELITTSLGLTFNNLSVQENLGNVRNSGIEGSLSATLLATNNTTWSATVNASHNTNKLLKLAPGVTRNVLSSDVSNVVGYPLYGIWARRVTYADRNGDHIIVPNEVTIDDTASYLGSSFGKIEMSYSTSLSLFGGKLALNALFDSKSGDLVNNQSSPTRGTLREQNDTLAPLFDQARAVASRIAFVNSLAYESGWFVRWRELSATINLPSRWLNVFRGRAVSVTAAVRNLGLWTHYSGLDPEVSDVGSYGNNNFGDFRSRSYSAVPLPRTWMIRLNAGF